MWRGPKPDLTASCYCFERTLRRCDAEERRPHSSCPAMFFPECPSGLGGPNACMSFALF